MSLGRRVYGEFLFVNIALFTILAVLQISVILGELRELKFINKNKDARWVRWCVVGVNNQTGVCCPRNSR